MPPRATRIYHFREGSNFDRKLAQRTGEYLESLERKHGGKLNADDVLHNATDTGSPLHGFFPWDDRVAARRHRLEIARALLRSIQVEIVVLGSRTPRSVRAFVNFRDDDMLGDDGLAPYFPIVTVLSDKDLRTRALRTALAEAQSWAMRYHHFHELAGIVRAIKCAHIGVCGRKN